MVKLINIIKEIKIHGKITPEIVKNLYSKIYGNIKIPAKKIREILYKFNIFIYNRYDVLKEIDRISKNQLNNLYNDLLNLQQKYNISEIKIIPNITPKMIFDLYREISEKELGKIPERQDVIFRHLKSKSVARVKDEIEEMSQNELLKLYQDLLDFKQKHESNLDEIKIQGPKRKLELRLRYTEYRSANNLADESNEIPFYPYFKKTKTGFRLSLMEFETDEINMVTEYLKKEKIPYKTFDTKRGNYYYTVFIIKEENVIIK